MNFLSAALGLSLFAVGAVTWCARLSQVNLSLVKSDHEMRDWAHETLETVTNIERKNRGLDLLDGLCAASTTLSPAAIAGIQHAGYMLALTQDALWKKFSWKLGALGIETEKDLENPERGASKVCVPGRLRWKSPTILRLESPRAGIRVARFATEGLRWRFESPHVRRRLE